MPDITTSSTADTLIVLRIPFRQDSIDYRPYAETLGDGSVLDWCLTRIGDGAPRNARLVVACTTRRELERLTAATRHTAIPLVCPTAATEVAQCRELMDAHGVSRILELRLAHAVVPVSALLRAVLQMHKTTGTTLTEVSAKAFRNSMFVVDSPLVDAVASADIPAEHSDFLKAATWYHSERVHRDRGSVTGPWFRLEMADVLDIANERWPQQIGMENAPHVWILREAVARRQHATGRHDHFIDAWKAAAITVNRASRERILRPSNGPPPAAPAISRLRPRVLYVSVTSYFHGASQSLCHLLDGLDRRMFEPVAAVSFEGVLTEELRRRGVTVICPNRSLAATDLSGISFAARLVQDAAPDLVHCNFDRGIPLTTAFAAASIPVVQHARISDCTGLLLELHTADAIIAVSELVKRRLAALDIDPAIVEVIRDGIDTSTFKPTPDRRDSARRDLGIAQDEFVVSTIGRMARQKRHETVVAAVAQLRRQTGRGHLLLTSAFDGDATYSNEIVTLIQREGLAPHLTHIDFTQDVPSILHASDCLALMSKDEALGRVVLEAMAVGRPVVVGESSGAVELIEEGVNGFVVPYESASALTSVLTRLDAHPAQARRIGEAAADTIQRSASATQCAQQTMAIYERILRRREWPYVPTARQAIDALHPHDPRAAQPPRNLVQ